MIIRQESLARRSRRGNEADYSCRVWLKEPPPHVVGYAPLVSYTRGNDLSGNLEGAGGIGGLLARSHGYAGGNWSTNNYYFADGNGNIMSLVDESQTLSASYLYDPFGVEIWESGTLASANVYRFSSKEWHGPTGLYYYGYRWYAPYCQKWLNRDPINELGFKVLIHRTAALNRREEQNLYRFVANNPISNWDYLGLDNPGCDPPGDKAIKVCPDKKDCMLRCCAEHDKCYYDNGCSASSWIIESSPECMACNAVAAVCMTMCKAGKGPEKGPRWFCPNGPNAGKFYDDYSQMPASCWTGGKKPPTPQPDIDPPKPK